VTILSEREPVPTVDEPIGMVGHVALLRALAHETRLHILGILSYRDLSPAELGRERGEPVSKVAYHFRLLEELGCAEVVRTRQVRGSVEHFYRRTGFVVYDDAAWSQLPTEVQDVVTSSIMRDLFGRMAQAMRAGTFNAREDRHLTWTPIRLDGAGWAEVTELLRDAFEGLSGIEARASARLGEGSEEGILATVALAGFESPDDSHPPPPGGMGSL
jgi:DNA-binding transcriptional ArsR family regulator